MKIRVHEIFYKIAILKADLKKLELLRNNLILKDLQLISNDKYTFSYRDLAKKYGVSSSTIQKIAEINNISRKNNIIK